MGTVHGLLGVVVLVGMLAGAGPAEATQAGCGSAMCVEVSFPEGSAGSGYAAHVRLQNRSSAALEPFTFTVEHVCAGGGVDPRQYPVSGGLQPGEERVLMTAVPVCPGTSSAPVGARVQHLPAIAAAPPIAQPGAEPLPPSRVHTGPTWAQVCIPPICLCNAPSTDLGCSLPKGGGDDGKLLAVVLAAVGVAALAVVFAVVTLLVGALVGWSWGGVLAKLLDRDPLEWWMRILLMDAPLGLGLLAGGVVAGLGAVGAYAMATQWKGEMAAFAPASALGGLAIGLGMVLVGWLMGGAAVTLATLVAAPPRPDVTGPPTETLELTPGDLPE